MQTDKLNLKDWSVADRPREKCVAQGLSTLTDAELIAILLRSGTRQETVVDLAKRVLSMSDNRLNRLSEWSLRDLQQIHGIGQTKAVTLLVAFELGRRVRAEKVLTEETLLQVEIGQFQCRVSPGDVWERILNTLAGRRVIQHDFTCVDVAELINLPEHSSAGPML